MNIGIIIRNNYGDTFPVALTPPMVSVIQNLLTQMPKANDGGIVGPNGESATQGASIAIIPRKVDFVWEDAYKPMAAEDERKHMEELVAGYKKIDEGKEGMEGDNVTEKYPDPLKKDITVYPEALNLGIEQKSPGKNRLPDQL